MFRSYVRMGDLVNDLGWPTAQPILVTAPPRPLQSLTRRIANKLGNGTTDWLEWMYDLGRMRIGVRLSPCCAELEDLHRE